MLTPMSLRLAGDFGPFQPLYAIEQDRIVLTRKRWPLAFAAFLPLGVWSLIHAFTRDSDFYSRSDRLTGRFFIMAGVAFIVWSALGAWMGLMPPRRVEITRERVRWGGRELAASELSAVNLGLRFVEQKGVLYYHWDLLLETKAGPQLRMQLCRTTSETPPLAASEVVRVAGALLGLGKG